MAKAENSAGTSMDRNKLFRIIVLVSRFGLAALFLFTAGAKLSIIKTFATNVSELLSASGFNYARWMWPVTVAVVAVELITATLLLIPRTVRLGALFSAALLIGFSGYALYYVYVLHGEPLECGCFGNIIGSQLGVKTALRNLALIVPAMVVFFGYGGRRAEASVPPPSGAAPLTTPI
jgi:methylamine utilization protein MauE